MDPIKKMQIEIAERLQLKWLQRMERLMDSDTLGSTDAATLRKFLQDNGWNVDETKFPVSLKDKLAESLALDSEDDVGELKIAGYIRR